LLGLLVLTFIAPLFVALMGLAIKCWPGDLPPFSTTEIMALAVSFLAIILSSIFSLFGRQHSDASHRDLLSYITGLREMVAGLEKQVMASLNYVDRVEQVGEEALLLAKQSASASQITAEEVSNETGEETDETDEGGTDEPAEEGTDEVSAAPKKISRSVDSGVLARIRELEQMTRESQEQFRMAFDSSEIRKLQRQIREAQEQLKLDFYSSPLQEIRSAQMAAQHALGSHIGGATRALKEGTSRGAAAKVMARRGGPEAIAYLNAIEKHASPETLDRAKAPGELTDILNNANQNDSVSMTQVIKKLRHDGILDANDCFSYPRSGSFLDDLKREVRWRLMPPR
jgi:hypothetical protein